MLVGARLVSCGKLGEEVVHLLAGVFRFFSSSVVRMDDRSHEPQASMSGDFVGGEGDGPFVIWNGTSRKTAVSTLSPNFYCTGAHVGLRDMSGLSPNCRGFTSLGVLRAGYRSNWSIMSGWIKRS